MIQTAKTTHHILIEISNYAVYQDPKLYEHSGEGDGGNLAATERRQRRHDNINKNGGKNEKNGKITVPYGTVVETFNLYCPSLPRVVDLSAQRKTAIKGFWGWIGRDEVAMCAFFRRVEASDFLTGRIKPVNFGFDWVIKPANRIKVAEGNYDNKGFGLPVSRAIASLMREGGETIDIRSG